MSDYLTPGGGSPIPALEGRRAIHISSERERIARQLAEDTLREEAALRRTPTRKARVVEPTTRKPDWVQIMIGFAVGAIVGAALTFALASRFAG